jgi:hypothetical protein
MLSDILYDFFQKTDSERSGKAFYPEDTLYFNPSSFSACRRQIFFKKRYIAPSNPIDAASYLKMDFGSTLHTRIQAIVKKLGILIEAEKLETAVFGGLDFRFKIDGLVVLNKERYIMEIKTTYSHGLYTVRDKPKVSDTIQIVLYMLFKHVSHGVLIYIGRDTGFMEEHTISKGDRLYIQALNAIEEKIKDLKTLETQIKQGELPEKDFQIVLKNKNGMITEKFSKDKTAYKTPWQCGYCQWKNLCWRSELEEIKNHKFFIENEFID